MAKATAVMDAKKSPAATSGRGVVSDAVRQSRLRECKWLEDLTGWRWDPAELGDFYHRIRKMPADDARWRSRLASAIDRGEITALAACSGNGEPHIREQLDDVIEMLRELARILGVLHGSPDLGNKSDPVDELVYIILSRKTRESAYQATFDALKARFGSWDELLDADRTEVEKLVWNGGLSKRKTTSLFGALQKLRDRFGSCTLEPALDWSDDELEQFLCSMPEIQRKSAYCVMMYAMGRKVFPVDTHVGRVLTRIAPFRQLGLDLDGMDHKKLQIVLRNLVPPSLRHSLHVNLVVHGREICKSGQPRCDSCELARFCQHARQQRIDAAASSDRYTSIDLFCGAGGMSLGFESEGFRPLLAVDSDPHACRTYRLNHSDLPEEDVICGDIREMPVKELTRRVGGRGLDVLLGSPPCQGFSSAGMRSKLSHRARTTLRGYRIAEDERNFLFEFMVGAALELRPRLFLMENVPGMDSRRKGRPSFMEMAENMLQDGGFETAIWKLDAASYGVPQRRPRSFLVASPTGSLPARPESEFQDMAARNIDPDALPPIMLEPAIFDLPEVLADGGDMVARFESAIDPADSRHRFYLTNRRFPVKRGEGLLFNHRCRYHNDRDLELYAMLEPGENSIDAIERHDRRDLMRYRTDVFDDKYARLCHDRPCKTIVSHLAKDGNSYIHPSQVRSLTVREGARIQSFPDDFVFCGPPSEQWIQVGNSVPPALAAAIARSFRTFLDRNQKT
jgi:DNA (cytosine-5)-methyltransferase 1